jgi:GxxExxY protein
MDMCALYLPNAYEESLAKAIVNCAYIVHTTLGPGLLEAVYEHCFCHELKKRKIPYARQVAVPLVYDGNKLPWGMRLDVLIGNRIICELKSVELMMPVFHAQILTQLKLVDLHIGFLINFNVPLIKEGIRRVIR